MLVALSLPNVGNCRRHDLEINGVKHSFDWPQSTIDVPDNGDVQVWYVPRDDLRVLVWERKIEPREIPPAPTVRHPHAIIVPWSTIHPMKHRCVAIGRTIRSSTLRIVRYFKSMFTR
jgi:hypothetical protein